MTDWPKDMFADCENLEQVVFQAIGAGSMCWEHRHSGGIFESDEAREIGNQAVARIRELRGKGLALLAVADELRALRELLAERLTVTFSVTVDGGDPGVTTAAILAALREADGR